MASASGDGAVTERWRSCGGAAAAPERHARIAHATGVGAMVNASALCPALSRCHGATFGGRCGRSSRQRGTGLGRVRDANLLGLTGAIERAESIARAVAVVGGEDSRDETRGEVVRQAVARARFGVFRIEEARAVEEPVEQLTFVVRGEAEREYEFVDLRLKFQFELCDGE